MAACSSEPGPVASDDDDDNQEANARGDDDGSDEDDDGASTGSTRDGGTKTGRSDGGSSKADGGAGGGSGTADGIPCAVAKIVEKSCTTCHAETPAGAPFSLASLEDFQGPSFSDPEVTMAAAVQARISTTDTKRRMPPTSVDPLSASEIKTLTDWLKGGAKAGATCEDEDKPSGGDAGTAPGKGGSGGASNQPIEYDDPDLKCYKLTSFATPSNKAQKYPVPTTPDIYVAFNLRAPWTGTQYIKSFKSIIDNGAVLHHWLLFRQLNGGAEGVFPNALGAHPDGEMLYGWAPGGDDMWFDPDVGMQVPANSVFQLEMHYNNKTGAPSPDASGVEVCVTPNKPAHIAGLSWVGTDMISGTSATGTCTHQSRTPIRLVASQPHMHVKGTNMKVDLVRGSTRTTVHDKPFDFNFQRAYIHNLEILPGDRLITTCTYSAPSRFGKGTNDEMCYFFSIHWPAGSLTRSSLWSIIHGPNTCID